MRTLLPAIWRGVGWKLGSDLLGRLLQYVLLWAAARTLGSAEFGDFTFALSIGLMLAQVADFGLQLFVQRELAGLAVPGASAPPYFSDEQAAGRLVGGGLAIKGVLSLAAMGLMAVLVLVEPVGNKGALLLLGFAAVLGTNLEYLSYCFRALRQLKYEAIAGVLGRAVNLALGLALLAAGAGVWGLAVAGNLAMLAGIAFIYPRLVRYVRPVWSPDLAYWRRVLTQPTAIGIGIIFSIISFRVDNLLIPPVAGREALGIYNAAYKLFEPAIIIPSVLLAATFPMIAHAARSDDADASQGTGSLIGLLVNNLAILLGVGAIVTLGMLTAAVPVVQLLYGPQFAQSAPVLQILALACVPMFLNYLLTHTLIAVNKQRLFALFTLLALVVNVGANLVLLPALGIHGAALATLLTELSLLGLCLTGVLRNLNRTPNPAPVVEQRVEGVR